jgi:glycosyltransferase involved in cell wall biosynthesis
MRIAIMGRILGYDGSGIQRLLKGLLQGLGQIDHGHEIVVFIEPGQVASDSLASVPFRFVQLGLGAHSFVRRIWWDHVAVGYACSKLEVDVLYAPAHVRPAYAPCPVVVMVPDMMYQKFPHFWPWHDRVYFRLMVSTLTTRAARIAALSKATKQDLLSLLKVPGDKVTVVYPGVSAAFRPLPREDTFGIAQKHQLREPFILFVGSFHPRKNLKGLLDAYAQIAGQVPHDLVVVGSRWGEEDALVYSQRTGVADRIRFLKYVPEPDLPLLYNAADLFVFPSVYEGFGFPVLEALACGCPTITTNVSSLPEVAGDAAILVSPTNTTELGAAICQVLADEHLRNQLSQRGLRQAQRFAWTSTAGQILSLLEEASSSR